MSHCTFAAPPILTTLFCTLLFSCPGWSADIAGQPGITKTDGPGPVRLVKAWAFPGKHVGLCPKLVKFSAYLEISEPGELTYHWLRPDGTKTVPVKLDLTRVNIGKKGRGITVNPKTGASYVFPYPELTWSGGTAGSTESLGATFVLDGGSQHLEVAVPAVSLDCSATDGTGPLPGNSTTEARKQPKSGGAAASLDNDFFKGPAREIDVRINGKRVAGVTDLNLQEVTSQQQAAKQHHMKAAVNVTMSGEGSFSSDGSTSSSSSSAAVASGSAQGNSESPDGFESYPQPGRLGLIFPTGAPETSWLSQWKPPKGGEGLVTVVSYAKGVLVLACSFYLPEPAGLTKAPADKERKTGNFSIPAGQSQLMLSFSNGSCQLFPGNALLLAFMNMVE
jgi:hypothetical protein